MFQGDLCGYVVKKNLPRYNMEMNFQRLLSRSIGALLLAASGGILLFYGWCMLAAGADFSQPVVFVSAWNRLIGSVGSLRSALFCMLLLSALTAAGCYLTCISTEDLSLRRRIVRTVLKILFAFYLFSLFYTLVFSRIDFVSYWEDYREYRNNWELMTNFVPFTTILLYLRCLKYDFIGTTIPLTNLMGNVLLFMPMAFFLPCLFPSMRKFWRFLVLMVAILAAVEALQLALCCGSCDIDDVILNLIGTLCIYGVTKIPGIHQFLENIYLF